MMPCRSCHRWGKCFKFISQGGKLQRGDQFLRGWGEDGWGVS